MNFLVKANRIVCYAAASVTGLVIMLLMLLFFFDISGRYIFNSPIIWAYEVTEGLMAIGICLGFAFTEFEEGHIRVRVLSEMLSKKTQRHLDKVAYLIALIMTSLYTWQTYLFTMTDKAFGHHTDILEIPMFTFHIFLPIGFGLWTLVLLLKLIRSFLVKE